MFNSNNHIKNEIIDKITNSLDNLGIMYRVFFRIKENYSLEKKLGNDVNYGKTKKLQDYIGIRIVLYFHDDIKTVRSIVSSLYEESSKDTSIDEFSKEEFKAVRYNIIYKLKESLRIEKDREKIDDTFELQIRTIFSEGWHEVEHDLRYKCKTDWESYDYESRLLNGVYASLETNEWTMLQIFDNLSYKHYKNKEWVAMIKQKFRLRFQEGELDPNIIKLLENENLAKSFFRLERNIIIRQMHEKSFAYPLTLNNFFYFTNLLKVKNEEIKGITPPEMVKWFEKL